MSTRGLAADVIVGVIHNGKSLDRAIEEVLSKVPKGKDRAFVQAISYGVLRHLERLESLLSLLARKPIRDPRIHSLALVGLYQIGHTRVPLHAAVSETVKAVAPETWAKPLLNAILRNYQRRQNELEKQLDQHAQSRFSHPKWLIERIIEEWPDFSHELLEANNHHPPLSLRVNKLKVSRSDYLSKLSSQNIPAQAGRHSDQSITLDAAVSVDLLPGFSQGEVSVQDEAAQLAAIFLDPEPGMRVLDLCAAPGGKSCHILESAPGILELWAVDNDSQRLDRIQSNLERLQLKATLKIGDALHPDLWWDKRPFDRILLDAPCSATGVIRRHPDIKFHRKPSDIDSLSNTQAKMLDQAWKMLGEGGRLLYATCSILKEENVRVIDAFLQRTRDAIEVPITQPIGIQEKHGRQILPGMDGMDGFYYACLEKSHVTT